jgi:catechol 2,3-dioxygenase
MPDSVKKNIAIEEAAPPFFAPRRLGHVNLLVDDIDRSMNFYIDVIGLQESYRRPLVKAGFVGNGNTHHDLGLVEIHGPLGKGRPVGLNHMAFELETEIDLAAGYHRALAAGVVFAQTQDHDIAHSAYARDSDGNHCELYADVVTDWRAVRSGVVTKPKVDWAPGMTPPNPNRNYPIDPKILRVEDAALHPRRTTHVTLIVADLAGALRYYTDTIGLRVLAGGTAAHFAVLGGTCGEPNLYLFQAGEGRQPGLHHFGFAAWDDADLDAAPSRLRGRGIEVELEIKHPLRRSFFVRDPDGFLLQFFVAGSRPLTSLETVARDLSIYLA